MPTKSSKTWEYVSIKDKPGNVIISRVRIQNENNDNLFDKYSDKVFINTYSFKDIDSTESKSIAIPETYIRIAVDSMCRENLKIYFRINGSQTDTVLTYEPYPESKINSDYSRIQIMNNPNVSYALLRTNPKLTGNVKVVVDSKNDIYLDTFKVSQTLSQKKYRHIKVSSSDYYGSNLMNKFKDVPTTEFYKIEDRCYSLFTPAQTYDGEFYDIYRMGVKTNDDKMYSENYSMFAPICLKEYTPDFFVIFKIDKSLIDSNITYDEDTSSDLDKLKFFIKNGTIVKTYDMRPESKLGEYVKNIVDNSSSLIGDFYESYDTQNVNRYNGISIDRGVATSIYESSYPEESITNQVALNEYYTKGFERNHIVSKNIVNLEFMFDDPDAELFSLNTYFGFYIKVNSSGNDYSCISSYNLDNVYTNVFDSSINTFEQNDWNQNTVFSDDNINTPFIYGITTPYEFIRLHESIERSKEVSEFACKPYKNLHSTKLYADDPGYVISFNIHKLLTVGDHIRIALPESKSIYEIICSNTEYYIDEMFCSEPITNIHHINGEEWSIYRVSLYLNDDPKYGIVIDRNANSKEIENLDNSIKFTRDCIIHGFRLMLDKNVNCFSLNNNGIGIKSSEEAYFERICAPSGFDSTQSEYVRTTTDEDRTIEFFNNIYLDKAVLDPNAIDMDRLYLYPINFELTGSRMGYIMKFVKFDNHVYYGEVTDLKVFDNKTLLYSKETEGTSSYSLYDNIDIIYFTDGSTGLIENTVKEKKVIPFCKNTNYWIFNVQNPILKNGNLLIYSCYPINDGVCSIFNVKDFDFDVLDSKSVITMSRNNIQIGQSGEYTQDSIFGSGLRSDDEESIYDYIDKYGTVSNNSEEYTDETEKLKDKLIKYYNTNHKSFDISLCSPYSCKWKSVGTDARGETMRLMFSAPDSSISYYVVGTDSSNNTYLGYLYNENKSDSSVGYRKYINKSLTEIIKTSYTKDLLLDGNLSIDDFLYDDKDNENKYSICYLSGENTLEFISGGIKFKIKSTNDNAIDLNNYAGYSAVFISFPGENQFGSTSTELIIDETKEEILICWYQGSQNLEYGNTTVDIEEVKSLLNPNLPGLYKINLATPFLFEEYSPNCTIVVDTNNNYSVYMTGIYPDYLGYGEAKKKLCNTNGLCVFNSIGSSGQMYTKYTNLLLYGRLIPKYPNAINTTEGYYIHPGYITINDPVISYDSSWGYATSEIYDYAVYNNNDFIEKLLFTDNKDYIKNNIGTFEDLKNDLQNHSVYIKTSEGKKDYTNLTGIIEMSIVEPIKYKKTQLLSDKQKEFGLVHPTYAEPVMKDMISFDYSNTVVGKISSRFKQSMNGSNIFVSGVNKISQIWINKYSTEPNYCGDATSTVSNLRTSIDVIHDKSIFDDSWKKGSYRRYYLVQDSNDTLEKYDNIDGYTTGYEQKNFFNSKGIQLKNFENGKSSIQNFEITTWKNTSISHIRKYIRIDISDSLIYKLLNDSNFAKAWDYLKLGSNNYKINYLKKTVLPLININNKTRIVLKRNNILRDNFSFIQDYDDSMTTVANYKNTLKYENGKYYMYIYPEDNYEYSVKMIIDL